MLVRRLSSEIISNEQIYGRLPSQPTDFDQMLTRINRVDLEELIRNQEYAYYFIVNRLILSLGKLFGNIKSKLSVLKMN